MADIYQVAKRRDKFLSHATVIEVNSCFCLHLNSDTIFHKKTILFLQRSRYLRTQIAGELLGGECRGIRNLSSQSECASTISSVLVHTNIVYYSNICKIHEVSLFSNTSHD